MASSINSRTAAIWRTCPKTCRPTPPCSGTTSSGALKACWTPSGMRSMNKCASRSKKTKWTRLLLIDSQAVKNTCNASVDSKGFCFYKSTNGIKRHLAVDTLGFPFFTHCTKANVSDDSGLIEMLELNIEYFKSKPVNVPKITILLDHGYHPDTLTQALKLIYPQIMTKIRFELSPKPSKAEKQSSREIRLCSRGGSLGCRALKCLDGAL